MKDCPAAAEEAAEELPEADKSDGAEDAAVASSKVAPVGGDELQGNVAYSELSRPAKPKPQEKKAFYRSSLKKGNRPFGKDKKPFGKRGDKPFGGKRRD